MSAPKDICLLWVRIIALLLLGACSTPPTPIATASLPIDPTWMFHAQWSYYLGDMVYIPVERYVFPLATLENRKGEEYSHPLSFTSGFLLMDHDVTLGEWLAVMGSNPPYFKGCGADCPVENVTRHDIQAFIDKISELERVKY